MGKKFESVLNVAVVRDELGVTESIDLSQWGLKEETGSVPAALWDAAKPNLRPTEPSAKLIDKCVTGIERLRPPRAKLGKRAEPPTIEWHPLEPGSVSKSATSQEVPTATHARNIQPVLVQKREEQTKIAEALATAGFTLSWQSTQEIRFRELQAEPLKGAVAA